LCEKRRRTSDTEHGLPARRFRDVSRGSLKAQCHRVEIDRKTRELQEEIAARIANATFAPDGRYLLKRDRRRSEERTLRPDGERHFR
jgi:hypothetical protein